MIRLSWRTAAAVLTVLLLATAGTTQDKKIVRQTPEPRELPGIIDRIFSDAFFEADDLFLGPGLDVSEPAEDVRIERTADGATVSLKIPGLDKKSLKIGVDRGGISLSCERRAVREDRDSQGRVIGRSESFESIHQILPIPRGMDSNSARIEPKGDEVRVLFKSDPRFKS